MTGVHAVADNERLPWLADDPAPRARTSYARFIGGAIAAILAVGGLSFWLGMNADQFPLFGGPVSVAQPEAPVASPQAARELAAPVQDAGPVMPQVEPSAVPPPVALPRAVDVTPARVAPQRVVRRRVQIRTATVSDDNLRETVKIQETAKADEKKAAANTPWTPWESAGAEGRMVRIGTYRTRLDAKRAWAKLTKLYPGMRGLRAVTNDIPSMRNGRTYYRLQFGTTSQAHSEVLCQRMRTIGQSCVVVDLSGARARNQDDGQPVGL